MRCSELLRASRHMLPTTFAPPAFARACAAPRSAVAELGVVRCQDNAASGDAGNAFNSA
jgi:hypothetical protein